MKHKQLDFINPIFTIYENGDVYSEEKELINGTGGKWIKPRNLLKCQIGRGYRRVSLFSIYKNRRITYTIHRLLALSFIPNPENKPYINHIDGNKLNNSLDNLEWCTPRENVHHAMRMGLVTYSKQSPETIAKRALTKIDNGNKIYVYNSSGELLEEFPTQKRAAINYNMTNKVFIRLLKKKILHNGILFSKEKITAE